MRLTQFKIALDLMWGLEKGSNVMSDRSVSGRGETGVFRSGLGVRKGVPGGGVDDRFRV